MKIFRLNIFCLVYLRLNPVSFNRLRVFNTVVIMHLLAYAELITRIVPNICCSYAFFFKHKKKNETIVFIRNS